MFVRLIFFQGGGLIMAYTYDNEGNLIDMDMKLPESKERNQQENLTLYHQRLTRVIKAKTGGPVKPVVRKENLDETNTKNGLSI